MPLPPPPPPAPVSYHRDVAAIFALHCNGCHGDAGGLSLRRYRDAMAGGNLGKVIIAGDAERSLLIHFVDGRRGEARRMPAGGRPLSSAQIETLRRWIDDGANEDSPGNARREVRRLDGIPIAANRPIRIACTVAAQAYLTVAVLDPVTGAVLWSEVAPLKSPKEQNDVGEPGEPLHWDVRAAPGWPAAVALQLTVEHAAVQPLDIAFSVR